MDRSRAARRTRAPRVPRETALPWSAGAPVPRVDRKEKGMLRGGVCSRHWSAATYLVTFALCGCASSTPHRYAAGTECSASSDRIPLQGPFESVLAECPDCKLAAVRDGALGTGN